MYDNATLCDECFLSMLTERMNSSYLANSEFNNYLTVELETALDLLLCIFRIMFVWVLILLPLLRQ